MTEPKEVAESPQLPIGAGGHLGGNVKEQLKAIIERVERLEEEKKATADDIKDVYAEAKSNGFDAKALRTIVRLRKMDPNERREQEEILDIYMHALGMLGEDYARAVVEEQAQQGDARTRKDIDG
jgi:uncharacterized protein (UPF0335 family)